MLFQILTIAHILLVTTGYVGLIAIDAWLFVVARENEASIVLNAVRSWRVLVRVFGPVLGLGVILGFADAAYAGFSLTALWLAVTYVFIIAAAGAQAGFMLPWQLRAEAAVARGEAVSTRPIATAIALFCVSYVAITSLMFIRP